jgi:hypothetical protein
MGRKTLENAGAQALIRPIPRPAMVTRRLVVHGKNCAWAGSPLTQH